MAKTKTNPADRWVEFHEAVLRGSNVMTVDPASRRTGIAIHRFIDPLRNGRGATIELVKAFACSAPASWPASRRVDQIVDQVLTAVRSYHVTFAAIETTVGKTSKRHKGMGAGLSIYGWAVGAVRGALHTELSYGNPLSEGRKRVLDVNENEWTTKTSKADRWNWCRSKWPSHSEVWQDDEGDYDVSDATYLYEWCVKMSNHHLAT